MTKEKLDYFKAEWSKHLDNEIRLSDEMGRAQKDGTFTAKEASTLLKLMVTHPQADRARKMIASGDWDKGVETLKRSRGGR